MDHGFDLLGDPIPKNLGKPGANGHTPTADNVNKVRLLMLAKWTTTEIAREIGVSVPTLKKHYFRKAGVKAARALAIAEVKGRTLLQLGAAAEAGSVPAMKEIRKLADREELADVADDARNRKGADVIGKKEARQRAAAAAAGSGKFVPEYEKMH